MQILTKFTEVADFRFILVIQICETNFQNKIEYFQTYSIGLLVLHDPLAGLIVRNYHIANSIPFSYALGDASPLCATG